MLSDSVVVIDAGRIIARGTGGDLKRRAGFSYCQVTRSIRRTCPGSSRELADLGAEADREADAVSVPAPDGVVTFGAVFAGSTSSASNSRTYPAKPSLDEAFLHHRPPPRYDRADSADRTRGARTLRDADLLFAVLAPVACFVGFTFLLRNVIDTGAMSYPSTCCRPSSSRRCSRRDDHRSSGCPDQSSGFGVPTADFTRLAGGIRSAAACCTRCCVPSSR